MRSRNLKITSSAFALALGFSSLTTVAQEMPTNAELWETIQQQKAAIDATVTAMEASMGSTSSMGSKTSLGGYGELHFNGGKEDKIDYHRYVLFIGHEFNSKMRFFSEFELEHSLAGEGKPGEVELEQAFVEFDLNERTTSSVGLQLVPVGILNETHEPPTFYGVERNAVEKNIIPSTWWEAGVKFTGKLGTKVQYDAMLHSGLMTPTTGSNAFLIRKGRQKVANAKWKNTAYTGRLTWMPAPGVNFGVSLQHQDDLTQSQGTAGTATSATLFEGHADIRRQISSNIEIGVRALYAQWKLNGTSAAALGRDKQKGWYIEPSYKYSFGNGQAFGTFIRLSAYDNNAGNVTATENKQTTVGVNYWPHPSVVLKADYQIDNMANVAKDDNRINLGIGVMF
jgi:phosphate-selective porin